MLRRSKSFWAGAFAATLAAGCRTEAPPGPPASPEAELRLARDQAYGEEHGFRYDGLHRDHPAVQALARLSDSDRGGAVESIALRLGLDGGSAREVLLEGADARFWNEPLLRAEERIIEGRRRPVVSISVQSVATGRVTPEAALLEALTAGQVLARRGEDFFLLPPWFRSGITLYASGRGDSIVDSRLAELLASGEPPGYLVRGLDFESPGGWDLAGYLAFAFVEREFGAPAVKDLVRVVVEEGVDVENSFAVALGVSAGVFRERFLAFSAELLASRGLAAQTPYRAAGQLLQAGRIDEAYAAFRMIAEDLSSAYAAGNARYRMGLCLARKEAWLEALAEFDRVLAEHAATCPLVDLAAGWRGECLLSLDRTEEGILALEEFVRDYPGSVREGRCRYLLGEAYLAVGEPERAREAFLAHRAALPGDDARHAVLLALGRIAYQAGEYGLARREFEGAAASPDAPTAAAAREDLARIDGIESGEPPPEVVERIRSWAAELLGPDEAAAAASEKLTRAGPLAIPYLGEEIAGADVAGRVRLIETLAAIGDPRAARHLLFALRNDGLEVQLASLAGLLDLDVEPESLLTLVEAIGRDMGEASRAALDAELARLFFHSTPEIRRRVPHLVDRLRSPAAGVRLSVLVDLNRVQDPEGVPVLVHLLSDRDPVVRHKALLAANLWGDARAREGLLACLATEDPGDRALAVELLSRFRGEASFDDVSPALRDRHPGVRQAAIEALFESGDPRTPATLVGSIPDPDLNVSTATEEALRRLDPRAVIPALFAELRRPDVPAPRLLALFRVFEKVSGNHVEFDPNASPEDRSALVQSLESWWAASGAQKR